MPNKQALVVGIDHYDVYSPLRYATNDANEFATALAMPEYNFDTHTVLDDDATANQLEASLSDLLKSSAEIKLFFFAGHGYSV